MWLLASVATLLCPKKHALVKRGRVKQLLILAKAQSEHSHTGQPTPTTRLKPLRPNGMRLSIAAKECGHCLCHYQ